MPRRINEYMSAHGRPHFQEKGAMVRAILEGLALAYRTHIRNLESLIGHDLEALHVVGGGSQNDLLNQFTADASGRRVVAGPVEATAIGNVLMQALATGRVDSLEDARSVVRDSFPTRRFEPRDPEVWRQEAARRASADPT
jgi:sugar (pentulose or hexulose) kinase